MARAIARVSETQDQGEGVAFRQKLWIIPESICRMLRPCRLFENRFGGESFLAENSAKEFDRFFEGHDKGVDFLASVVKVKAGSGG